MEEHRDMCKWPMWVTLEMGVYVGEGGEGGRGQPRKNKMKHVSDHSFNCF